VVVKPGDSIQAAIDSLSPQFGGCVCLKAGQHPITEPIRIDRSNVHLHGECEGAEIDAPWLEEVLLIAGKDSARIHDVRVDGLRIVIDSRSGGFSGPATVVRIVYVNRASVSGIESNVVFTGAFPPPCIGIAVDQSSDVVLADNAMQTLMYGVRIGNVAGRAWVQDNRFLGVQYVAGPIAISMADVGIEFDSDIAGDARAERNTLVDFITGVRVAAGSQGAKVIGHRIFRTSASQEGAPPGTADALRAYLDSRAYAIELLGGICVADDNYAELNAPGWGGIRIQCPGAVVSRNVLLANLPAGSTLLPAGIYCTLDATSGLGGAACTIRENALTGAQAGIVVSRVDAVSVIDNRIDGQGRGWYGVRLDDTGYTTVAGNLVASTGVAVWLNDGHNNVVRDGRSALSFIGIAATGETQLTLQDNEITAAFDLGIAATDAVGDLLVARNRVQNCGWAGTVPIGVWVQARVMLEPVTASVRIEDCEILEAGVAPGGFTTATTAVVGLVVIAGNCQVLGNRVVTVNATLVGQQLEHRALGLLGPVLAVGNPKTQVGSALIANNVLRGPGLTHLVEAKTLNPAGDTLLKFRKIQFNGNFCDHLGSTSLDAPQGASTVFLSGVHVAASANQITAAAVWKTNVPAPISISSLDCDRCQRSSIVGNVTSGAIVNVGTTLPTPVTSFNMQL
jgi:hypothetical protein